MVGQGKLSDTEINVLAGYIVSSVLRILLPHPLLAAIPGPEEQPDDSKGKVVEESDLRGGSHMTMQTQYDAVSGPTYVEPQTTLDKGKGKAVEKSVPKKHSRKPDPGPSSSKTRRTKPPSGQSTRVALCVCLIYC